MIGPLFLWVRKIFEGIYCLSEKRMDWNPYFRKLHFDKAKIGWPIQNFCFSMSSALKGGAWCNGKAFPTRYGGHVFKSWKPLLL